MRPVNRGICPTNRYGISINFTRYSEARDPLIERIGDYCSYCEMRFPMPAVEHIKPKSTTAALALVWTNFLLACPSCNSAKGTKVALPGTVFWPDIDNTFRAFKYEPHRGPQPADGLVAHDQTVAEATLQLTGLDREPGNSRLSKRDRRWLMRKQAWDKALHAKDNLLQSPGEPMASQVLDTATSTGFWSVWMTVFSDDPQMMLRFLDVLQFPGTSGVGESFDSSGRPVPRPAGAI